MILHIFRLCEFAILCHMNFTGDEFHSCEIHAYCRVARSNTPETVEKTLQISSRDRPTLFDLDSRHSPEKEGMERASPSGDDGAPAPRSDVAQGATRPLCGL